jgi:hypothetical protein
MRNAYMGLWFDIFICMYVYIVDSDLHVYITNFVGPQVYIYVDICCNFSTTHLTIESQKPNKFFVRICKNAQVFSLHFYASFELFAI